eukprot:TRINITY_DN4092_c1_g3_i2.p1 TRINITY_DN4092_c1_g3~~TRINITY_DN4092_c1_g3_i2.p1  ORF type:complete len:287 (-),score=47.35 TRINITY_DN4092_c1_g3_i2:259-1119(-)
MRILLRPQPQQHPEERLCVADEEDDEDEEELDDDDDEVGFESNQEEDGEEEEVGDELLFWDENVPEQAPAAAGAHRSITPSRSPQLSSPPLSEYFFEAWLQSLQMRFELPSEALKELASEGLSKQVDFTHRFASEDEVGLFCDARGLSALTKTRLRQAWVNCRKDAEQDSSDSEVGSSLKRRRLNSRWSGRTTTAGSHTSSQNSYDQAHPRVHSSLIRRGLKMAKWGVSVWQDLGASCVRASRERHERSCPRLVRVTGDSKEWRPMVLRQSTTLGSEGSSTAYTRI